ncbi:ABC transporter ATP-binding protein [Nocardioides sp. L-11A]|uniref:ABC transporter ATP-binding protein n=1 Tax=Nocardioides sp. L-11A TaxID=3043848 RepID=UPI00249C3C06|nr:ABC transporter ATP-binding protein [Nocardioides sp. L-11A]
MSFENASAPPRTALWARGVVRSYGEQQVLRGVDFTATSGESVALTGPSGSGKTTLLHVLSGIAVPDAGEVVFAAAGRAPIAVDRAGSEERARLRRGTFGMVFQSGQLLGELTAVENVALPLLLDGRDAREAQAAAAAMFGPLGLDGLQQRRPGELSGGQQQRVAIARALVPRPAVLFADEPTGALDRRTGDQVMRLLLDAQRATGVTLVVVTHDPEIAALCDRVVTLRDGRVLSAPLAGAGR